jgi:hypothetical protein
MSDEFLRLIRGQARHASTHETSSDEALRAIRGQAAETYDRPRAAQIEQYGVPVDPEEYEIISRSVADVERHGMDPQEELHRWAGALQYSRYLRKPLSETYANLDSLNQWWLGRAYVPKTDWKAIGDSFRLGTLSVEMGRLAGQWRDSGGADDSPLKKQLDEMYTESQKLQDAFPRPWYVELLKSAGQSAPFTMRTAGVGLAVGAAFAGMAPAAATAATVAMLQVAGARTGSFLESFNLSSGLEYYKQRTAGVEHGIAAPVSAASGGIQAALEVALGNVPGLVGKLGGKTAATVAGKVAQKLAVSGRLGAVGRAVMAYGLEHLEEGGEEALQDLTSSFAQYISAEIQDGGVERQTADQVAASAWENFKGGVKASLVMGIPGAMIGYRGDVKEAKAIREMAAGTEEAEFLELAKRADLATFRGMSDEQRDSALKAVWAAQQGKKQKTLDKLEEKAAAAEGKEKPVGEVKRLEDGRLYTSERVVSDRGETTRAVLKAGDPQTGTRYGYIDYQLEEDKVVINRVATQRGVGPEVRREMVLDLMGRHPGMEISWDSSAPADRQLIEELAATNPRGKEAGLQWYGSAEEAGRGADRERLRQVLEGYRERGNLKDSQQVEVALDFVDRGARFFGTSTDEFLKAALAPEMVGDQGEVNLNTNRGGTAFRSIGGITKAVVHLSKTADLSTWIHEMTHVLVNFGLQHRGENEKIAARMAEMETAFGVKGGDWNGDATAAFEEWFASEQKAAGGNLSRWELAAYALEDYLKTGRAPSEQVKPLLEKLAEWFREIYRTLRNRVQMSDEITAFFDRFMEQTSEPAAAPAAPGGPAPAAEAPAAAQEWPDSLAPPDAEPLPEQEALLFQAAPPLDSAEFRVLMAGSKVVDAKGNPIPIYHGSKHRFETFDPRMIGSRSDTGFYSAGHYGTPDPLKAGSYGPFRLKGYVNLQNPLVLHETGDVVRARAEIATLGDVALTGLVEKHRGKIYKAVMEYGSAKFTRLVLAAGHDGVMVYALRAGGETLDEVVFYSDRQFLRLPTGIQARMAAAAVLYQGGIESPSERAEAKAFLEGDPVAAIPAGAVPRLGKLKDIAEWAEYFFKEKTGGQVEHPVIGPIALNRKSIKDSLSHGYGAAKVQAIAALPGALPKARLLYSESQRPGQVGFVLAAPVQMGGADYYLLAMVRGSENGNRLYIHEAVLKEKAQDAFKTGADPNRSDETPGASGLLKNVLQNVLAFNPETEGPNQKVLFQVERPNEVIDDPAQLQLKDLLKKSEHEAQTDQPYYDEHGHVIADSRRVPVEGLTVRLGQWMVEDRYSGIWGHQIYQLRELDPHTLLLSENLVETNEQGRGWDADRYAEWLKEGKTPPPISVVETDKGALAVVDGHRRVGAAMRARMPVLAWVSPMTDDPTGWRFPDGRINRVPLTWESAKGIPFDSENPEHRKPLLFQAPLVAYHNISPESLQATSEIGGMPMPSIAVTKAEIPFSQFGTISLIGGRKLADPLEYGNRTFDRDIWSPTVPAPQWKVSQKAGLALYRKLEPHYRKVGDYIADFYYHLEKGRDRYMDRLLRDSGAKAAFLAERGIEVQPVYRASQAKSHSTLDLQFVARVKELGVDAIDAKPGDPIYQQMSEAFWEATERFIRTLDTDAVLTELRLEKARAKYLTEDGRLVYSHYDRVVSEALNYRPGQELDEHATADEIDRTLKGKGLAEPFVTWLYEQLKPVFTEPYIQVGAKKLPYTAEAILAWMSRQKTVSGEKTITYGPEKARASSARPFGSVEEMHGKESRLVPTEEERAYREEKVDPLVEKLKEVLPPHFAYDDPWDALNSTFRAIARYLEGGTKQRSAARMKTALARAEFRAVPAAVVELALDTAHAMAESPTDYFEAKPERVVKLTDFTAAVIPDSTPAAARESLAKAGLAVVEYPAGDKEGRFQAVQEILRQHPEVLFQGPSDSLAAQAGDFDSWQEFRDFIEAMYGEEERSETARLSPEAKDAWYKATWERARAAGEVERRPQASGPEAADQTFLADLQTDEGIERFLRELWEDAIDTRGEAEAAAAGPQDAEELAALEKRRELAARTAREAHPLIHASAVAVGRGRVLKPATVKAIRTLIGRAPREYRALHAAVTGDTEAVAELEAAAAARPEIRDPRWVAAVEGGSITERIRLARSIKNEALAKRIRSGEVELGADLEDYIGSLTEAQAETAKKLEAARKDLLEYRQFTTRLERDYAEQRQTLKAYQRELDLVNRRIATFLKKQTGRAASMQTEALLARRERILRDIETVRRQVARAKRQAGANTARAVAYLNKLEALSKLREQQREREAERRAAKKVRERMLKLARAITRKPSAAIDIEYADRIEELQKALDPKFRSQKTLDRLARSRAFFEGNEEARANVPQKVLERIQAKPLNEWTMEELEDLAARVEALRRLGRLKRRLIEAARRRARQQDAEQAQKTVLGGRPLRRAVGRPPATGRWTKVLLSSLRPDRIAQMLGGGIWKDLLIDRPNAQWAATMRAIDKRVEAMSAYMDEHGFTADPLDARIKTKGFQFVGRPMEIGGFRYDDGKAPTLQDVLYWSIGMKNERTRAALLAGNNLDEQVVEAGIKMLTAEERALAERVSEDFQANFQRLRAAVRRYYNIEISEEDFYVPMRRRDVSFDSRSEEIAVDFAARNGLTKTFIEKGFIKQRIDIENEKYQTPVRTDLISLWHEAVQKEEAFIHLDSMVKDLHAVLEDLDTKRAVQQRFGPEANKWIAKYVNDLSGADLYGAATGAERLQRALRSNLAVAYLSFNVLSNAKQLVSVLPFLADAGPARILAAAGQYLAAKGRAVGKGQLIGNAFIAEVEEKSPAVKHRSISREFEELKRLDGGLYQQVVKKVGSVGMKSLEVIDKVSVAIGWKATYDHARSKGATEAEAVSAADAAVARTQPSGRVQDMAEMYRAGEGLKWFTMFTNALNAYWNMLAWDIPQAVKAGQLLHATGDLTAIAISGLGIALVAGALAGDDEEEKRKRLMVGIFSQYTDAIPLLGTQASGLLKTILGMPTFSGTGVSLFPAGDRLSRALSAASRQEYEAALAAMLEGTALALGLPTSGPKRAMQAFAKQNAGLLLGWKE